MSLGRLSFSEDGGGVDLGEEWWGERTRRKEEKETVVKMEYMREE